MAKYRKKPVIIEAIQYTGENVNEILAFGENYNPDVEYFDDTDELIIHTLEGDHLCSKGDFVIQGIQGELYPCKPDIFKKTYEEIK